MAEIDQTPVQQTTTEAVTDAGAYSSFVLLMDAHNELLQGDSKGKEKEAYLTAVQNFLERARATGAVLQNPEERYTAQSLLNYWITVLYRADIVYSEETTLAAYDAFAEVKIEDERCPYPGVRPFQENEHKFFFGRQRQINYMLSRLREDRLLAIVGPSGSGKTSLVMAGLLPEMKANDRANQTEHYYFPVITPGSEPLKALSRMFEEASGEGHKASVEAAQADFHNDLTQLLKLVENSTQLPTITVVDQFHEIFTCANPADRRAFLGNLEKLIDSPGRRHTIIAMMQEVNYESYLGRPEQFRKRLDPAKVSLPSLGSLELRDAIEKPGSYVGLKFPESIVKALVNETMSEPVGLPLLQFMLFKLWTAHANKEDIKIAFDQMHCCREALANSAEQFFSKLDFRDNAACRRLLKQLVAFDSDFKPASRPVKRADLHDRTGMSPSRIDSLIKRLEENQLIRVSRGAVSVEDEVELTHESLLRNWPRMKAWVDALKASRKRWLVAKIAGTAVIAVLAFLIISTAIGWVWEKSKSKELSRLSKQELAKERFDLALLLGLGAYQTEHNTETEGTLLKLLHNFEFSPRPVRFLTAQNFSPEDLSFSPESDRAPTRLAAINDQGRIVIWNLNWEHRLTPAKEEGLVDKSSAVLPIIFSPDAKLVATASREPNVLAIVWDTTTHQPRNLTLNNPEGEILDSPLATALAFSPNGKLLFTGGPDGKVVKWDITDPKVTAPTPLFEHTNMIRTIAVDAAGAHLAVGDNDGAVFILDLTKKQAKKTVMDQGHATEVEGDELVYSLAFNQAGSLLAASRASAQSDSATIWNVATGKLQQNFSTGLFSGLLVGFTGEELTGFNTKGVVFTWDPARGGVRSDPIFKPLLASTNASFSTKGNFVALPSPHRDGAIVWDLSNRRALSQDAPVSSVAFKPDEKDASTNTLLIGTSEGIELFRTTLEEHSHAARQSEQSSVTDVAYSPDASKVATALNDGTIHLRDSNDLQKAVSLARNLEGTRFTESIAKIAFNPVHVNRLAAIVVRTDANPDPEEITYEIAFWDTNTASETPYPNGKPRIEKNFRVTDIAFSRDGEQVVWSSTDDQHSKVTIWAFRANKIIGEFSVRSEVFSLAFHPKQHLLAVGLGDGTTELWDVDSLQNRYSLRVGSGYVNDLAFNPEGSVLACATNPTTDEQEKQSTITLWDVTSREQLGDSLKGHEDMISSIAFSPNGNILASGAYDGTVRLWGPLKVDVAETSFCEIIDCRRTYPKVADNRVTNPLDDDSFFQRLYRWVFGRQSLREIHKIDQPQT